MSEFEKAAAALASEQKARQQAEQLLEAKAAEISALKHQLQQTLDQLQQETEARATVSEILARLPEEIPDPVLRISRYGTISYTNSAYKLCWQPHLLLKDGDAYPSLFQQAIDQAILQQEPYLAEYEIGRRSWSVQFNAVEQWGYVNILARDITDQKLAEEKISKSQAALLEAQELGNLGRWEFNLQDITLEWSPQLFRQYGLEPEGSTSLENDIFLFVHPDDLTLAREAIQRGVQEGYAQFEHRIIRTDGSIRHLFTTVKAEYSATREATRLYGTSLDVTELRKTEAQLRESEERFQLAMQGMNDGLWDYNVTTSTIYISPQWKQLLGYQEHELENTFENFVRFTSPEDLARIQQLVEGAAAPPDNRLSYELRMMHRDGSLRHMLTRCIVLRNEQGEVSRVVGANSDITEEIKAKERLVNSLNQLKILSQISFMFNSVSEDFEQPVKDAIEMMGIHSGASRVYIFENSADGVFASNTFEWCQPQVASHIDTLQNIPYSAVQGLRKTLVRHHLFAATANNIPPMMRALLHKQDVKSLLLVPFFVREEFTGFVGFDDCTEQREWETAAIELLRTFANLIGNIFERQQAEFKVLQSEEKYRSLVENLTEIIFQADAEGRLTYLNPAWTELTNHDTESSLGKPLQDFVLEEDQQEFLKLRQLLLEKKTDFCRQVMRIRAKDNSVRYVEFFARLLEGEWGQADGLSGTLTDVTVQQNSQEKLIKAKEIAEKASQVKAQFLSVMSHEIRTPLNAMLGISHLLLRQQPRPEQEDNLRLLKFSGENLLSLINDILDFNKIESGKLAIEQAPFDLRKLCHSLYKAQSLKASEKQVQLLLSIDPALPERISGDATRLTQILNNLLDNAIKFTHQGHVKLAVQQLSTTATATTLGFSVEDTGIGIEQASLNKIFDTFTQVYPSSQHNYGGTGLGLAIIKRLLELLGSKIEVSSSPGKGTQFSFRLECGLVHPDTHQASVEKLTKPVQQRLQEASLLLVEDNPLNMLVLVQFCGLWGIQPDVAENGAQALQKIKQKHYDLVLMDLHMPEVNGLEASRRIRQELKLPHLPIIALTANALPGIRQQVTDAGMNDYLSKPFEPEELYQKIVRYLPDVEEIPAAPPAPILQPPPSAAGSAYSLQKLYYQSNNNAAFVERMVMLFIKTCTEQLNLLTTSLASRQDAAVRDVAHKLKPSIDLFDIHSLKGPVRQLEQMQLDALELPEGKAMANHLLGCLQEVVQQLEQWLEEQAAKKAMDSE